MSDPGSSETSRGPKSERTPVREEEEAQRSDMEFSREAKAGRGNEMSEADADDVPCKLNNAKLSERTKERARWKHRNVMNLSEAEIHSLKVSGFRWKHEITFFESLILAQDERWRRA